MSSEQLPHDLIDLSNPVDRREFLRGAGKSSLAAGLLAAGLGGLLSSTEASAAPAEAPGAAPAPCRRLTVLSKHARTIDSSLQCSVCECHDHRVFTVNQKLLARLFQADCDETQNLIPDGSQLLVKLVRKFRLPGPCQTWVGYHGGTFEIRAVSSANAPGPIIFRGNLNGTDGLNSEVDGERCCWPLRDEGALVGRGSARPTANCTITASYKSELALPPGVVPSPELLCNPEFWRSWTLSLVGIIDCPCPKTPPPPADH